MKKKTFNNRLFHFIQSSPTPFHAAQNMATAVAEAGFTKLDEKDEWLLTEGKGYYLIRDGGSIICFTVGKRSKLIDGFRMLGAHTDSPCLKIKPQPGKSFNSYNTIGVELYGGPLLHPWFDRELSIAGRISCRMSDNSLLTLNIDFKEPMAVIPSLAIHFNREANKDNPINAQKDLPLLLFQSSVDNNDDFHHSILTLIKKQFPKLKPAAILGTDLFCYDCHPPSYFGPHQQFICGPRLDNLLSCFVGITSMVNKKAANNSLLVCTNHEEVGSTTSSGASGSLLSSFFERILPDSPLRHQCLSKSILISMDNAHALHPNYPEKSDETHPVLLNHGPVIKSNSNQRYATNSIGRSIYRIIAEEAGVPTQDFVMRSDLTCGSTIGPITAAELGLLTIDIGAPSLAMHSIRETTGADDPFLLYKSIQCFLDRKTNPAEELP